MTRIILVSVGALAFLFLVLVVMRTLALVRPVKKDSSIFFSDTFEIVAHRGGALEAPENTLAAFYQSSQVAPDIIFELDVRETKDHQLVVMHDATVDRTTNGSGKLRDLTLAELKQLDAGYQFKNEEGSFLWRGRDVHIPTLKEVLNKFSNRIIIEIKDDNTDIEKKVIQIILDAKAQDRIMIGSQNGAIISRFRKLQPSWNYSASRDDVLRTLMLQSLFLESTGTWLANAFLIPEQDNGIQVLSEKLLNEAKRRGKKILVWTVNNESDMQRLKSLGVNGLITDRPTVAYKLKTL